jgi:cell division protease FtsH
MHKVRKRQFTFSSGYLLAALAILWGFQVLLLQETKPRQVAYSEFLTELDAGRIKQASLREDEIVAELKPKAGANDKVKAASDNSGNDKAGNDKAGNNKAGNDKAGNDKAGNDKSGNDTEKPQRIATSRLPRIDETHLLDTMREKGVVFSGQVEKTAWWSALLFGWVLPFVVLFGLWSVVMRRIGKNAGPLSVGKAQAKIFDKNESEPITFQDVAGIDEAKAELVEIVGFLKEPSKYLAIGARAPKGVLLVGPPGTGKTLLARAVAGEAGVPFFSISGSEFVQMFVGVGASRVRDLFEQAKERAPCIVFIDELDAIGRSRSGSAGGFGVHEEREQTLNQLLVEMDGFDSGKGVVMLAATNRPEVLDQALLRAGRFDRQVLVDRPDVRGREGVLRLHARKVKLAADVELKTVAQRTPGMVGADLANVVNEAALAATRRGGVEIMMRDFEEAVDRMQLGLKKQGRVMTGEERRRVAYHESGHTLVALSVTHADPVHRVTIIPRSIGALGATLQLPADDRYLITRDELRDRICVMLAGRAAEEIVCVDISTGAQNDLERSTETARQMVCRFGMSDKLGPQTFGQPGGNRFLETPAMFGEQRNFSEETARLIDAEVKSIVEIEHARALSILEERRELLSTIAERLLIEETLERTDLEQMVATAAPLIADQAAEA